MERQALDLVQKLLHLVGRQLRIRNQCLLLILACWTGCQILPKTVTVQPALTGDGNTQRVTVNEPMPINILAWFMGGSILMGAMTQAYYTRLRVKQHGNK